MAAQRVVLFRDAAHVVFAPFWGRGWSFTRLFVKAPAGRHRLNGLAAVHAITHELFTVENLTSITAETVCELLRLLARASQGLPLTIILDNARDQRGTLVQSVAEAWGIELLFLPAYSPNLNLMERFWRFVKKQWLYSKYYPDRTAFHQAILSCIHNAPMEHQAELNQLLTLRFQTFQDVPVIGEQQIVSKTSKKKVLSKAA